MPYYQVKNLNTFEITSEKNLPPPEAVDNCTNILNDLWDEVRNLPEGEKRKDLYQNLLTLVGKVENYGNIDDTDALFNEPEIRRFNWWENDKVDTSKNPEETV